MYYISKEGDTMEVMKMLKKEYGYDEPILLKDIRIKGVSEAGKRQIFSRMSRQGKIARYSQGVYYIPSVTALGVSKLGSQKVYEVKYISDGKDVYGYYTGLALDNRIGFTTQMPNVIDIVTNNERSRVREVKIGNQLLRLRKGRTVITAENVKALQLFDLIKNKDWDSLDKMQRSSITEYIKKNKISRSEVIANITFAPASVAKKLMESGLIDELI